MAVILKMLNVKAILLNMDVISYTVIKKLQNRDIESLLGIFLRTNIVHVMVDLCTTNTFFLTTEQHETSKLKSIISSNIFNIKSSPSWSK